MQKKNLNQQIKANDFAQNQGLDLQKTDKIKLSRTQKLQSQQHFKGVIQVLKTCKKTSKKQLKLPVKLETQIVDQKVEVNKTLKYLREAKQDLQQRIHNLNTRQISDHTFAKKVTKIEKFKYNSDSDYDSESNFDEDGNKIKNQNTFEEDQRKIKFKEQKLKKKEIINQRSVLEEQMIQKEKEMQLGGGKNQPFKDYPQTQKQWQIREQNKYLGEEIQMSKKSRYQQYEHKKQTKFLQKIGKTMDSYALMEEDKNLKKQMVKYIVNKVHEHKQKTDFLQPEFIQDNVKRGLEKKQKLLESEKQLGLNRFKYLEQKQEMEQKVDKIRRVQSASIRNNFRRNLIQNPNNFITSNKKLYTQQNESMQSSTQQFNIASQLEIDQNKQNIQGNQQFFKRQQTFNEPRQFDKVVKQIYQPQKSVQIETNNYSTLNEFNKYKNSNGVPLYKTLSAKKKKKLKLSDLQVNQKLESLKQFNSENNTQNINKISEYAKINKSKEENSEYYNQMVSQNSVEGYNTLESNILKTQPTDRDQFTTKQSQMSLQEMKTEGNQFLFTPDNRQKYNNNIISLQDTQQSYYDNNKSQQTPINNQQSQQFKKQYNTQQQSQQQGGGQNEHIILEHYFDKEEEQQDVQNIKITDQKYSNDDISKTVKIQLNDDSSQQQNQRKDNPKKLKKQQTLNIYFDDLNDNHIKSNQQTQVQNFNTKDEKQVDDNFFDLHIPLLDKGFYDEVENKIKRRKITDPETYYHFQHIKHDNFENDVSPATKLQRIQNQVNTPSSKPNNNSIAGQSSQQIIYSHKYISSQKQIISQNQSKEITENNVSIDNSQQGEIMASYKSIQWLDSKQQELVEDSDVSKTLTQLEIEYQNMQKPRQYTENDLIRFNKMMKEIDQQKNIKTASDIRPSTGVKKREKIQYDIKDSKDLERKTHEYMKYHEKQYSQEQKLMEQIALKKPEKVNKNQKQLNSHKIKEKQFYEKKSEKIQDKELYQDFQNFLKVTKQIQNQTNKKVNSNLRKIKKQGKKLKYKPQPEYIPDPIPEKPPGLIKIMQEEKKIQKVWF